MLPLSGWGPGSTKESLPLSGALVGNFYLFHLCVSVLMPQGSSCMLCWPATSLIKPTRTFAGGTQPPLGFFGKIFCFDRCFVQRHPTGRGATDASLSLSKSKHKTHTFGGQQDDLQDAFDIQISKCNILIFKCSIGIFMFNIICFRHYPCLFRWQDSRGSLRFHETQRIDFRWNCVVLYQCWNE